MLAASDPDLQSDPSAYGADVIQKMFSCFGALVARHRAEPTEDLGSLIANGMIDGAPMVILKTLSYQLIASTAGHETTNSAMGGGMLELLSSPGRMHALRAQPGLWDTAADYELTGVKIMAGDSLGMFYLSAKPNKTVFERANEFLPGRSPNCHLGFGLGGHVCLGCLLVLSEIRALFRELFARVLPIKLDGEAQWVQSYFVRGHKRLPVRYRMA